MDSILQAFVQRGDEEDKLGGRWHPLVLLIQVGPCELFSSSLHCLL